MPAIIMVIAIMIIDGFVGYAGYILLITVFLNPSIPIIGIIIKAIVFGYYIISNTYFPSISGLILKYRISTMHENQKNLKIIISNILFWGLLISYMYFLVDGNKIFMLITGIPLVVEIFPLLYGKKMRLSFIILNLRYEERKIPNKQ